MYRCPKQLEAAIQLPWHVLVKQLPADTDSLWDYWHKLILGHVDLQAEGGNKVPELSDPSCHGQLLPGNSQIIPWDYSN